MATTLGEDAAVEWPAAICVPTPVDERVLRLFALVHEAVGSATQIFLDADRDAARSLMQRDQLIDALHEETEKAVMVQLTDRGSIDTDELHRLLVVLRILPELERSGDLAEHIASHAVQGLASGCHREGERWCNRWEH